MEKGGTAHKLAFDRVGHEVPAERDAYRRVYLPDGRYHYPKIPENLIRRVGEPMWKSLEITGSNEGTKRTPKFSLLKWFETAELP